jgi:hypothetical protein
MRLEKKSKSVGGARALLTFIDVDWCSLHSAHASFTIYMQLHTLQSGNKVMKESIFEGELLIRSDGSFKSWKSRYFILLREKLMVFRDKDHTGQVGVITSDL